MIMKEIGPMGGGHVSGTPLRSTTEAEFLNLMNVDYNYSVEKHLSHVLD